MLWRIHRVKLTTDVAIIGSGIGGLCCAALLANEGYQVTILERLPVCGGRYTSVKYKGFTIPTASWMLLYGKDDPVYQTLSEVGANEIEMRTAGTPMAKYRIGGKIYDWPENGALKYLLSIACEDAEEVSRVMTAIGQAMSQIPSNETTFNDWLLQYSQNEWIHDVFQAQITTWCGMNSNELPAGEFLRTLLSFQGKDEFQIPRNGLKDIIDAFEKSIKDNGGRILNFTTVEEIIVENGQVRGITAQKDSRIELEAKIVISNVGPRKTIELAGTDSFGSEYLNLVSERIKPTVGMDYLFTTNKPLLDFPGTLYTPDTRRKVSWSVPTMMWPEHAQGGKHLLHGFAVPESTLDYDPAVEQEVFMQDLIDVFPDFNEYGGELLLRRNFCGEWPCTRSWQGYDIEQETPIRNLYNVGDGVKPQGWIVGAGAAESGRMVAKRIMEESS